MYITPRTLLGIIRTAQAHAKCRFSNVVEQEDIDEAIRLIDACRESFNETLEKEKKNIFGHDRSQQQVISDIFKVLKDVCTNSVNRNTALYKDIEVAIEKKGFTKEDLFKTMA